MRTAAALSLTTGNFVLEIDAEETKDDNEIRSQGPSRLAGSQKHGREKSGCDGGGDDGWGTRRGASTTTTQDNVFLFIHITNGCQGSSFPVVSMLNGKFRQEYTGTAGATQQ